MKGVVGDTTAYRKVAFDLKKGGIPSILSQPLEKSISNIKFMGGEYHTIWAAESRSNEAFKGGWTIWRESKRTIRRE